ncbi:hypothetical protein D9V32_07285 [Mycetocola tolaasinivorans]|uniref:Uncharacterized protein n=1 Tax=Mycetocola tolaasinivorans TaxID=76635 RepID=A0A3L7A6J8_9MICO|nr:hypothetical protein [Mycetocola tolaasinivorans]RLP75956.1 hypothetical protein D9V32_07285 [Mycetocola tolaasinivorans]
MSAQTEGTNGGNAEHDHVSDPAHSDEVGSDWTDEGGATKYGAATHVDDPDAHELPADSEV